MPPAQLYPPDPWVLIVKTIATAMVVVVAWGIFSGGYQFWLRDRLQAPSASHRNAADWSIRTLVFLSVIFVGVVFAAIWS